MRWRRAALWVVAAGAVAAALVSGLRSSGSSLERRAPSLPRELLSGAPVSLSSLTAGDGQPVVITFWASWCGPCAHEAPALERFSQSPSGRGRLVGVNWSDSLSSARSFIRRYAWTFSNLRDGDGVVGNEYRLTSLPTSFVVDPSGRIRDQLRGPQDERSLMRALASIAHS